METEAARSTPRCGASFGVVRGDAGGAGIAGTERAGLADSFHRRLVLGRAGVSVRPFVVLAPKSCGVARLSH